MGKFDEDRQAFLPIFWFNITERQRKDYELAKKHFGPLYRIEDTNYFMKKLKEYQGNPASFNIPPDPPGPSDKPTTLKNDSVTDSPADAETKTSLVNP